MICLFGSLEKWKSAIQDELPESVVSIRRSIWSFTARIRAQKREIMSSTSSESIRNEGNVQPVRLTSELRIDAPHFVGISPDFSLGPMIAQTAQAHPTPELLKAAPPAIPLMVSQERLQRQANELGARLEDRCRDLDQREAQLNTRSAEFDRELRAARLWISEKQVELREREERLEAEARALSQAVTRHATSTIPVAAKQEDGLSSHETTHSVLTEDDLNRRCEELKVVERRLRDARTQLEECRVQLIEKRSEFDVQVSEQRKLLENYQNEIESQLAEKREKIERQARTNEQIQIILQRCREEIERKHRETLQLRLATEELWVRMSDGVPSTTMLQSLSKIRSRLADEYREAEARLAKPAVQN